MPETINPNLVPPGENMLEWVYNHLLTDEEREEVDLAILAALREEVMKDMIL